MSGASAEPQSKQNVPTSVRSMETINIAPAASDDFIAGKNKWGKTNTGEVFYDDKHRDSKIRGVYVCVLRQFQKEIWLPMEVTGSA